MNAITHRLTHDQRSGLLLLDGAPVAAEAQLTELPRDEQDALCHYCRATLPNICDAFDIPAMPPVRTEADIRREAAVRAFWSNDPLTRHFFTTYPGSDSVTLRQLIKHVQAMPAEAFEACLIGGAL